MVPDAALLNTQHYKVWIKSKVEQSREKSSTLPLHLCVVAIEKESFELPTTPLLYVKKWALACFKNLTNYIFNMYEQDLVLNNLQELIRYKTQRIL